MAGQLPVYGLGCECVAKIPDICRSDQLPMDEMADFAHRAVAARKRQHQQKSVRVV